MPPSLGVRGNNRLGWEPGHTEALDLEAQRLSLDSGLDLGLGLSEADPAVALDLEQQQAGLVVVETSGTSGPVHGLELEPGRTVAEQQRLEHELDPPFDLGATAAPVPLVSALEQDLGRRVLAVLAAELVVPVGSSGA